MTAALLGLLVSGTLLVVAGSVMTGAADTIAERSGLGRLWIGSVLLASATSLPELATDVAAVRLGVPDLAVGDLFGSSMANMLILSVLVLLSRRRGALPEATPGHVLTASLAIALNAAAGTFVVANPARAAGPLGPESVLLGLGFLAGLRVVHAHAARPPAVVPPSGAGAAPPVRGTLRGAATRFGIGALAVVAAAPIFAESAKRIAELTGLGATFVGTLLVGLSTSVPELVTSLAALRIGAIDLAIGNLFGSNAFNMAVFLPLDLVDGGGSIFAALDPAHAISALLAVVLMAVGTGTLVLRGRGRAWLLEPGGLLLLLLYLSGLWLLYLESSR